MTALDITTRLARVLTPGNTFTGEKFRGAVTSILTGSLAGGLNLLGVSLGMNPIVSASLFLYLVGNVLGYTFDILFAKQMFILPGESIEKMVPYTAFGPRLTWLMYSFFSKKFYRFIITVLIDTLIGLAVLKAALDFVNRRKWLMNWNQRDAFLAICVAIFTYLIYNNILRFDWAYRDTEEPFMILVVLMWISLVLMLSAVTYKPANDEPQRNWVVA